MARTWVFACVFALAIVPAAQAASLSKSYSYFTIRGKTLDEIQEQLDRRGPRLRETGRRHAGATRMEFKTHAGYRERNGRCEVTSGKVTLVARVILPRWSQRGASEDVRLVWETLAADIKRHEEAHVTIARKYAREIEAQIAAVRPQRSCALARKKVEETTDRLMRRHNAEQDRFDEVEAHNFESRLTRLLDQRMRRAAYGR